MSTSPVEQDAMALAAAERARGTVGVARLSVISNTALVVLKLVVGILTGAVSVVAEGLHSAVDLVAAIIAFLAVRKSNKPPDSSHPFGHGKFESLSGAVEAILIFVAAGGVAWVAIRRMVLGHAPEKLALGMGVMLVSAVVNIIVSRKLLRAARKHDSLALEADGWHLLTDVYTSVAVLVGLGLVYWTGYEILDPIAALAVAAVILHAAYRLTREALRQLLDASVDPEIKERIRRIVEDHHSHYVDAHKLRARRSGAEIHVDLHLVVCRWMPTGEAHDLASHIEADIEERVPGTRVLIHIESPEQECEGMGEGGDQAE